MIFSVIVGKAAWSGMQDCAPYVFVVYIIFWLVEIFAYNLFDLRTQNEKRLDMCVYVTNASGRSRRPNHLRLEVYFEPPPLPYAYGLTKFCQLPR